MEKFPPRIAFVFLIIGMALSLVWREWPSSYIFALSQIFNLLFGVIILVYAVRKSPPMKRIQFIIIVIVVAILAGALVFWDSIYRLIHSLGINSNFLPWLVAAILFICLVWFIIVSLKPKTK